MSYTRPRRSRHTVTLADGEKKVILAYSADDARRHYNARAATPEQRVVSVVKGDHRFDIARGGGWHLNRRNLLEAIEMLGIKHQVEVKQTHRQGSQRGAHRAVPTGGRVRIEGGRMYNGSTATGLTHRITVKSYLTPKQAGETLWHELTHAMQTERNGGTPAEMVRRMNTQYRDGTPYKHKPLEVEARAHERFNDDLPLAR